MISTRLDSLSSLPSRKRRPPLKVIFYLLSLLLFFILLSALWTSNQHLILDPLVVNAKNSLVSPPISPQSENPRISTVQLLDEVLRTDGVEEEIDSVIPERDSKEETQEKGEDEEEEEELEVQSPALDEHHDNNNNHNDWYTSRFLPHPQLFFPSRTPLALKFQMHNCLKGRDGSKAGLADAGIRRVTAQKNLENMPLHFIDPTSAVILSCNAKVPVFRLARDKKAVGRRLISTAQGLLSKLCLGSTKSKQLECRRDLARHWKCDFESLGIQPRQFLLNQPEECAQFMSLPTTNNQSATTTWLSKPSGGIRGRGIKYFSSTLQFQSEIQRVGGCLKSNSTGIRNRIAQEYVANPALIDGKFKFDCRTWLLVASVDPLLVFYHEGFVRVAKQRYNEKSTNKMVHITNAQGQENRQHQHLQSKQDNDDNENDNENGNDNADDDDDGKYMRSFAHVNVQLSKSYGFPRDFMHNDFAKQMKRAQAFAALSQFQLEDNYAKDIKTRRGFYQIYACDSMVDRLGRAHLLECNGFPAEAQQTAVSGKEMWGEMIALLLNLHLEPWELVVSDAPPPPPTTTTFLKEGVWKNGAIIKGSSLKANEYSFGGWELIFNEVDTPRHSFDVCKAFGSSHNFE